MRLIFKTGPGKVGLATLWLPGFVAYDARLLADIEKKLAPEFVGKELTDEVLDHAHERVVDLICEKHAAIVGLRDYLDAVKFVEGPAAA